MAYIWQHIRARDHRLKSTPASVDHECKIGDGTHISPGVNLPGGVTVGQATWVGLGAKVIEGIKIGSGTMIGAGAVVVGDIPDSVFAMGSPTGS
jgi:acetyltransferase-like isoleucine patch superfamily enzyme